MLATNGGGGMVVWWWQADQIRRGVVDRSAGVLVCSLENRKSVEIRGLKRVDVFAVGNHQESQEA